MRDINSDKGPNGELQIHRGDHVVSRRNLLAGTAAGISILALIALPGRAVASFMQKTSPALPDRFRTAETHLGKYLCGEVHPKLAAKLDAIIDDPNIDGEQTVLALMQTRCPGCGERVDPATRHTASVLPKWKTPASNNKIGAIA